MQRLVDRSDTTTNLLMIDATVINAIDSELYKYKACFDRS